MRAYFCLNSYRKHNTKRLEKRNRENERERERASKQAKAIEELRAKRKSVKELVVVDFFPRHFYDS